MSRSESEAPAGGSGIPDSWCTAPARHERPKPRHTSKRGAVRDRRAAQFPRTDKWQQGTQDCEWATGPFCDRKGSETLTVCVRRRCARAISLTLSQREASAEEEKEEKKKARGSEKAVSTPLIQGQVRVGCGRCGRACRDRVEVPAWRLRYDARLLRQQ